MTTLTFNRVKLLETIDLSKLMTKDEWEALDVFKSNKMDENVVATVVYDVIDGIREVHQALYKHDTKKINNKNLKEIKDYYYEVGYKALEEDTFIEATYRIVDILCGNDDMDHVKEIALAAFGSSFTDLYTTKATVRSEVSNFIYDVKLINQYVNAFADLDDLNYLLDMCDEYMLNLVKIHQYYYQYDDSQFTTISGDAIGILCESYYDNRCKVELLKRGEFMGAIDYLLELIDKEAKSRAEIIKLIDTLFDNGEIDDCDYFEGLTDFDCGDIATITNDEIKGINKYVALQDEYFNFHESVNQFSLKLDDMLASEDYYRESDLDLLHKIQDLFDTHVEL
ncbi:hypothetical protein [Lysinibacillus sphaericus]|uniref:hypothetical protein n=1 Tax=Lysinibacillus sphaericus TaxID=1421 RepID=UPI003CFCB44B